MHITGVCIRIYTPGTLLDANLQSWSVKSLLYFVVCFIVWTGEYHTLVVVSLLTQPQMYNIFSVLCLLYPQLIKMEHLNRAMK